MCSFAQAAVTKRRQPSGSRSRIPPPAADQEPGAGTELSARRGLQVTEGKTPCGCLSGSWAAAFPLVPAQSPPSSVCLFAPSVSFYKDTRPAGFRLTLMN